MINYKFYLEHCKDVYKLISKYIYYNNERPFCLLNYKTLIQYRLNQGFNPTF